MRMFCHYYHFLNLIQKLPLNQEKEETAKKKDRDDRNDESLKTDFDNENDEVNGDDDQVKTEELFDSIAIFLFFPLYKYRKKRWPGKLDQ